MKEMKEILQPYDKSREQRRLVIGGVGGVGKTQLAIAYGQHHPRVYESVFWLSATSETTLKDSFQSIAELIFNLQGPATLEGEQILIQVCRWLSDTKNTQWLLIFDNYDDPGQFNIEAENRTRARVEESEEIQHIIITTTDKDSMNSVGEA